VPAVKRRRELRRRVRQTARHLLAETRYLRLVWHEFRWTVLFAAIVWSSSVVIMHQGYPAAAGEEPMAWSRAAYYVFMMTAFGASPEYHEVAPWPVKAVYFALPLLGLFVLIDAFVRFSGLLFARRVNTKEWQALLATTYSHHVVVCGLGHVGYRIVQQLVASGTDCVAIEQHETEFVADVQALGVPVILGDVRKADVLRQARVPFADALIAATDQDMVNIESGLNARELKPDLKIVLRLFDQALAKKIEKSFSFDAAFSTSALAAPVFAAAAVTKNVINSFVVEGKVLNTVEMTVRAGSRLDGRTVDSLREAFEVTFLMMQVGSEVDWNPAPERRLGAGTKVLVVTTLEALDELETLNQEPGRLGGTTTRLAGWIGGRREGGA
jgi:Trk K+ transport system NAD-binding subunit